MKTGLEAAEDCTTEVLAWWETHDSAACMLHWMLVVRHLSFPSIENIEGCHDVTQMLSRLRIRASYPSPGTTVSLHGEHVYGT